MAISFMPKSDACKGDLTQRLALIMDAALQYKTLMGQAEESLKKTPGDIKISFNWVLMGKLFKEIQELPENSAESKFVKVKQIKRLIDVYEVLRQAKMAKLESVKTLLLSEIRQLEGE